MTKKLQWRILRLFFEVTVLSILAKHVLSTLNSRLITDLLVSVPKLARFKTAHICLCYSYTFQLNVLIASLEKLCALMIVKPETFLFSRVRKQNERKVLSSSWKRKIEGILVVVLPYFLSSDPGDLTTNTRVSFLISTNVSPH